MYAQVEPTSVTPFSSAVLDRALHAVMASYVLQTGNAHYSESPYPYPKEIIEYLKTVLIPRVKAIDPMELETFNRIFEKRAKEWKRWERTEWWSNGQSVNAPLLRAAGQYVNPEWELISWATPMSMRNVDVECRPQITGLYLND